MQRRAVSDADESARPEYFGSGVEETASSWTIQIRFVTVNTTIGSGARAGPSSPIRAMAEDVWSSRTCRQVPVLQQLSLRTLSSTSLPSRDLPRRSNAGTLWCGNSARLARSHKTGPWSLRACCGFSSASLKCSDVDASPLSLGHGQGSCRGSAFRGADKGNVGSGSVCFYRRSILRVLCEWRDQEGPFEPAS
jgi:hypothetical protein